MAAIKIVFWSQSGNTEKMANAIAEGIKLAGKEAEVRFVTEVQVNDLKDDTVVALGCPAMGAEVLEEEDMEPFVQGFEAIAAGKNVALFGSYGWGDGEWMRDWVERMIGAGANVVNGEGIMINEVPDEEGLEECRSLGKQLAML